MIKSEKIPAIGALLIPFAIYLSTLANTVSFFDSGELIAGAATLGISHPPGYPLYLLTGHLASYLPLGNLAFRVNLFSAIMGALAVFTLYHLEVKLLKTLFKERGGKVEMTAFSTALIFSLSLNHWGQTNMSEVYALNTFLVALLILLLITWREKVIHSKSSDSENHTRWLFCFSFLFGLGMGDHHTILVAAPLFLFVVSVTRWQLLVSLRILSLLAFFFILGFSVYLYLPLRATADLIMNWGDPQSFAQFKWMFLREGYPQAKTLRSWDLLMAQLKSINLLYEFTLAGFILALTGLVRFFRRGWLFAGMTLIVLAVLSVGIVVYGNPPRENIFLLEAFHTPTYLVFSLWIGASLFWLFSLLTRLAARLGGERSFAPGVTALWMGVLILLPALLFYIHFSKNNRSRNFIAFDYAVNELKSLTSNGILFTWGDSGAFPLWYLQFVERYQPDTLLLHTPHLASDWYVDEFPDLRRSRLRSIPPGHREPGLAVEIITNEFFGIRKAYIDYSSKYSFPTGRTQFMPHGLVYVHTIGNQPVDASVWDKYVMRDIFSRNILRDLDISKAISIYGFCRYDTGAALLKEGRKSEAINEFIKAMNIVPGLKTRVQRALYPPGGRPPG